MTLDLTDLVETPLGAAGVSFIRDVLDGETGLAGALAQLDFGKGETFAYLPRGMPREEVMAFQHGHLIGFEHAYDWIARRNFLRSEPNTIIIHDQWMSGSNFQLLKLMPFELRTPAERYFVLHGRSMTRECLDTACHVPTTNFIGAAVNLSGEAVWTLLQAGDPDSLRVIIDNTREIFINAYDEESFVLWTR